MAENTYTRGEDIIDLDTLLSSLKSNFDSWLDTRNLSNLEKSDVRTAYDDLFALFSATPSNFIYDPDNRAFSTTSQFPNTPAYRRAAGYLGEVIRTSPRKEKDKDKDAWDPTNSKFITEDILNLIISDPDSFIALDSSNPYSYTNRLNTIINYINNNLDTIIDLYSYSSTDDRNKAEGTLKLYLNNLLDTADTSDDFYILAKLGFTNPTEILGVETVPEPAPEDPLKLYRLIFLEWASSSHPLSTPSTTYNLKGADPIQVSFPEEELNITDFIDKMYNLGDSNKLKGISGILQVAFKRKLYKKIGDNKFRVGLPNDKNEIYVFDTSDQTLTKYNAWDIPEFRDQYFREFLNSHGSEVNYNPYDVLLANLLQSTQSHKNGGILKFQEGGDIPTRYEYWMGNYINPDDTSGTYSLNSYLTGWEGNKHNSRDTSIGNSDLYDPTPLNSLNIFNKYANSSNLATDVLTYYNTWTLSNLGKSINDFINAYNTNVLTLRNNSRKMFTSGYGPGNENTDWRGYNQLYNQMYSSRGRNIDLNKGILGYSSDLESILGQTTFARVPSLFSDDTQFKDYRSLTLNGLNIWINNEGELEIPTESPTETTSPAATETPEETTPAGSQLQEELVGGGYLMPWDITSTANLFDNRTNSKFYKGELQNAIMSGGRLGYSLATNLKIKDIMNKALKPFILDPYRLYSPVTGDLGARMMAFRQAALNRQAVNRPITTDSNKMMSYLMESNRQANDIEERGRLADNTKIEKSRQEALARQEANTKLENLVANANRKAIIDNIREKAELEATNKKINWKSVDDYLKNIESRLISRKDMQLAKEVESLERTAGMQAEYSREAAVNAIRSRYYEYAAKHPGTTETNFNTITNGDYFRALRDANNYVTWGYLGNLNRIYGIPYDFSHIGTFNPFSENYVWNNSSRWEQLLTTDQTK